MQEARFLITGYRASAASIAIAVVLLNVAGYAGPIVLRREQLQGLLGTWMRYKYLVVDLSNKKRTEVVGIGYNQSSFVQEQVTFY